MSRRESQARSDYLRGVKLMNAMLDEKMLEMLKWCEGSGVVEDEPGTLYQLSAQEQKALFELRIKESLGKSANDQPSKKIDKLLGRAKSMLFEHLQFSQADDDVRTILHEHSDFTYYKADLVKVLGLEKQLRVFGFSLEDNALYDILTIRKMVQSYPLCSRLLGLRAERGELVKPTQDMRKALKSIELLERDNPWSVEQAIKDLRCCHYPFNRIVTGLGSAAVTREMLAPLVVRLMLEEGQDQSGIDAILTKCEIGQSDSLLYKRVEDNWKNTLVLFLQHYNFQRSQGPQHKGYKDRRYEWEVRIGFSRDEKTEAVTCLLARLEQSGGQPILDEAILSVIMQPYSNTRGIVMDNLPDRLKQGGIQAVKAALIAALGQPLAGAANPLAPEVSPGSTESDRRTTGNSAPFYVSSIYRTRHYLQAKSQKRATAFPDLTL